jgi:predicted TIM-barrel fold metal-dependent hydrolase
MGSQTDIDIRERKPGPKTKAGIIDCDIHPAMRSPADLNRFLSARWQHHRKTYREHVRRATTAWVYHRMDNHGMRLDATPPEGGPAASDLDFMRKQHLDHYNIEFGVLQPLSSAGSVRNREYAAALCRAMNEWQLEDWTSKEKRLKASIVVNPEFPEDAVAEIDHWADHPDFVQVTVPPRCSEPLGRSRYWPIFEAAQRHGLPIGLHVGGINGHPSGGGGWPSYYLEEHQTNAHSGQAVLTSMVIEGVFERFRNLKVVMIEAGFGWVPALSWRLDKHWDRLRDEVPHLKRPPSEYVREHFWFSTQPVEEPANPEDLTTICDWIGWHRLVFATDYPHWDFDDPNYVFKTAVPAAQKQMVLRNNAKALFRFP